MDADANWHPVAAVADLERAGKLVARVREVPVLLLWNNGTPIALNDTCIHRGRSLSEGVLLNGKIVCAGHQWAFDLATGYCKVRDDYQPVYGVRIEGGWVEVDGSRVARTDRDDPASSSSVVGHAQG